MAEAEGEEGKEIKHNKHEPETKLQLPSFPVPI